MTPSIFEQRHDQKSRCAQNLQRSLGHYLTCPRCREQYLHHGAVTVYDRREDEARVTVIEVRDQIANPCVIDNNGSGNPSDRRDGLAIEFHCEHCDEKFELTIAQHKGWSFIAWRGPNGHADDRA